MTEVSTSLIGCTVGLSVTRTHCTASASSLALLQSGVSGTDREEVSTVCGVCVCVCVSESVCVCVLVSVSV